MQKVPDIIIINLNKLGYEPEYENLDDFLIYYLSERYGDRDYKFGYYHDEESGYVQLFDVEAFYKKKFNQERRNVA